MATVAFQLPAASLCSCHRPSSSRLPLATRRARIRCSAAAGDAGEESSGTTTATTADPPLEIPVGTSKRSSSLISTDNIQKALRGIAITSVDHYERLGIARGTSYAEVTNAYKIACEELMSQDIDEDEISHKMDLLKESYAILSSEEERRLYDWSLARGEKPDRYVWPFEVDITQTPTQPPPPQEPEDVGPTRLVGYFFLAWIILSFALSVTLNR
uniref:Chaperone protein DnaJ n=1 Tax=Anthurium amnicola TaxID=1678845 RepID=A0A1D1Z0M8_9ARAE